jgi:ubiquinone/menaquinone biosynthesis C-methylase UbiE
MNIKSQYCSCTCDFEILHEYHAHPAMRKLEREVLGCDFGGTSWTTRQQAEEVPPLLGLRKGISLLEIGAGTGWPGVFTAGISGCDLTMLDLPVNSLKYANSRAQEEGLSGNSNSIAASGSALPFADDSFDAIGHSDVLCCLPDKLLMLSECARVLKKGAAMVFFVIAPAQGLDHAQMQEALKTGPPFVGVPDDYTAMLKSSGWNVLERKSLTDEYQSALQRLVNGLEKNNRVLSEVMGEEGFFDQLLRRRNQISAIDRSLLVRERFFASIG